MPTTSRSRTLPVPVERVWELVADPHHLPRWWPRVARVEGVDEASFTEVLATAKGRMLRADFRVLHSDPPLRRVWAQELEGTPFARVLSAAQTEVRLDADGFAGGPADATVVTLELRQSLRGVFARLGSFMVRRATARLLDEALDGLESIVG